MPPIAHPGRLLKREMQARNLSANRLALDVGAPSGRVTDILTGRRSVTAETAARLSRYFGHRTGAARLPCPTTFRLSTGFATDARQKRASFRQAGAAQERRAANPASGRGQIREDLTGERTAWFNRIQV